MVSGTTRADEPEPLARPEVSVDRPVTERSSENERAAKLRIDRTWLYGDDARIAPPLVAIATSSFSYTNVGNSPTRVSYPQPDVGACIGSSGGARPCYTGMSANTAQPGAMVLVGGELGLLPRISIQASVVAGLGAGADVPSPNVGATAAMRFQVLPDSWEKRASCPQRRLCP